jgi:hypothetical protein
MAQTAKEGDMSIFDLLFGGETPASPSASSPGTAGEIARELNPQALVGAENGIVVIIEDVTDPDGRMFRMEYQATPDGKHALAYCRYNPWGSRPNAGTSAASSHVFSDGSICMGSKHYGGPVQRSPYNLRTVMERARYWCTGFSVYKETGQFPNP